MKRIGFGDDHTIQFDMKDATQVNIHVVTGAKPHSNYQTNSGRVIRKDCAAYLKTKGIDAEKETIVIFCNMSTWDAKNRIIKQNSPYYARGTQHEGTAWQVDSPILKLADLTNMGDHVRDGQYGRITLGKYNTIFIGGIAHELGHALGLPHNKERKDQSKKYGIALIGAGNRAYGNERRGDGKPAFITLAHSLKLASHPMFSGYTSKLREKAKSEVLDLKATVKDPMTVSISGKVQSDIPCYGVIAYLDPAGGSDYDATTITTIPAEDGSFSLDCSAFKARSTGKIRIVTLHVNGSASSHASPDSKFAIPYKMDAGGGVNISLYNAKKLLAEVVKLAQQRKFPAAVKKIENLLKNTSLKSKDPQTFATLESLRDSFSNKPVKPTAQAEGSSVFLSDTKAKSMKVGWQRATRNHAPTGDILLMAGGNLYPKGLFAHAPARHVYQLDKKWSTLTGECGMASGKNGSVTFEIKGDGRTLWRSRKVTEKSKNQRYRLDVSQVSTLEFTVTDAGDGNRSDWGLWLDPKLSR